MALIYICLAMVFGYGRLAVRLTAESWKMGTGQYKPCVTPQRLPITAPLGRIADSEPIPAPCGSSAEGAGTIGNISNTSLTWLGERPKLFLRGLFMFGSPGERARAKLEVQDLARRPFAAFDVKRCSGGVGGPQPLAFPAGFRIVNPA